MKQLQPFVGTWHTETSLGDVRAVTTFEWALGGAFLLQKSEIDLPEAPDGLCVIAARRGALHPALLRLARGRAHLRDDVRRDHLDAHARAAGLQRLPLLPALRGQFAGNRIDGRWEIKEPGDADYRLDFEQSYIRA